ncbi:xanthine dehydrogenase accessory protein XdhC [Pseudoduganella umbonata]|uniref:Xanthine dehydrogenase accessory factor n=1 Tax=Pseudoduganella umbonata TaxID=864828 RepID=A0A4P8HU35_9BURK|nr:xanthine dehydrogenase accessory protein XdhC [Pseudoduganella umbonata]MBB3223667.1 xanthine dehydrogenase accessory factor [Pseudoduganella umbonata]QCP13473.1 xanthine dehydrogenase accessory protein XdhC [Pseudoduganella umbonata]
MNEWLTTTARPAVLVTVARVEGSAPREPGAKFLVTESTLHDTIGGGHLELRAVEIAREMLAKGATGVRHERFGLGPSLGQCCGGVVWLLFEPVTDSVAEMLTVLRGNRHDDYWRVASIAGRPRNAVFDAEGTLVAGDADVPHHFPRTSSAIVLPDGWLVDPVAAPAAHLVLFGAGHVGAAIVRALAELPCTITWVDERDDMFPAQVPANVIVEATDTPEAVVASAPPGASYLVLTHSHALDERLSAAILARDNVGWFGLIGSKTKRVLFERRLAARGLPADRIDAMVCPIGLPGITDKAPAVIAASVAAQLLITWEAQAHGAAAMPRQPALQEN